MQRMLCAATVALVLFASSANGEARSHVHYRTKCVGLYCWPVAEPTPPHNAAPQIGRAHV